MTATPVKATAAYPAQQGPVRMIVDVHCHAWPDAIAERALASGVPQLRRMGDGKVGSLREVMARSGVDNAVILGVADQARNVDGVNRFVAAQKAAGFFGFGTVHPDLSVEENMASLQRHGITGVKLHTLFQGFSLDDKRIWALLDAFGSSVAVIAHVGGGGSEDVNQRGTPRMVRDIVSNFPRLRLIACHFGGYHQLDAAEQELVGLNLYLETSWPPSMAALGAERVRSIISRHGAERIVFGSDWPMADPAAEIAAIRGLGLGESETDGILGENFLRFVGAEARRPPGA